MKHHTKKKMNRLELLTLLAVCLVTAAASAAMSCGPSKWGFDSIDAMTTPADGPMGCGAKPTTLDSLASARAGCAFVAGARASDTLGITPDVTRNIPIRHVIVVMKENRSFDHLFGKLHDQGQPATEGTPPSYVNLDAAGNAVAPFHANTTCIQTDPTHQSTSMLEGVNGGKMDGFVKSAAAGTGTDGHFVMSQYESSDIPLYYWLAKTYALSDRHFAPMQSGTYGVRNFMMFGWNAGVVDTGISYPDPDTNSIFRSLMNKGFTWGAYSDSEPFSGALGWTNQEPGVHTYQELLDSLDRGDLPNVAFVDADENVNDDHPTADLQAGEVWLKKLYDHAVTSPQWPRLAILWSFDEGGGFADHVAPPKGCLPTGRKAWPYPDFGPRVPLVAISPWAKMGSVSHVPHDHTAITRFIETIFDLPALTVRDANSDALFDLFDFSCGRDLTPPSGAPAPGTGGCVK
ncbi:MAG: hypothetical protein HY075_02375 [Deltaproteobacteria bacterium]|nr:hypothetical protein [Deltaproteobacteria bacterium]